MSLRHLSLDELPASGKDHDCSGVGPDQVCAKIAAVADGQIVHGIIGVLRYGGGGRGEV